MKQYIESGKYLANQYQNVCDMILNITDRMAEEWEALYEMAYRAREVKMPDKNMMKSSPVESVLIKIEKMRNEMDEKYCAEIAELERKRMDMDGIISSAGLTPAEDRIFHLRYGLNKKRLNYVEIGDLVYYSERHVKRVLDGAYSKIGKLL